MTQLWNRGGSVNGGADCAEASLCRYLREAGYPFSGTDQELISQLRLRITGIAESNHNLYTSTVSLEGYMRALGILDRVIVGSEAAVRADWTISLVHGVELFPAQYPFSWFGVDAPDHYILALPGGLFNDPLADYNGGKDCAYARVGSTNGVVSYALHDPNHVTWHESSPGRYAAVYSAPVVVKPTPPPPPPPPKVPGLILAEGSNVRDAPSLGGRVLITASGPIKLAGLQKDADAAPWYPVVLPGGKVGYVSHVVVQKTALV